MSNWIKEVTEKIFKGKRDSGTNYSESEIHGMARSSLGAARGLFSLRGTLIGLGVIAVIIALPIIIISSIFDSHPEWTCEHAKLDDDSAYFDFDNKVITLACAECRTRFTLETNYRVLESREATCTQAGILVERLVDRDRMVFAKEKTTVIPKLPHSYDITCIEAVEPTCTESGTTAYMKCSVCETWTGGDTVKALGHASYTQEEASPSTCQTNGKTALICCSRCETVLQSRQTKPLADHRCETTTVPPEEFLSGYDLHECIWCDYSYRDNYVAPLYETLRFKESSVDCELVGVSVKTEKVYIPEYYNGKPVTRIRYWTFQNNDVVKEVHIPSTVKEIEESAFWNCPNLEKVVFSEGLETIESWAFRECPRIEELVFPASLKVLYPASFEDCTGIRRVYFHEDSPISDFTGIADLSMKYIVSIKLPANATYSGNTKDRMSAMPVLAEVYGSERFMTSLPADIAERYNLKTDYSLESSVFIEDGNFYLEKDGRYYLALTLDQSKQLILPDTVRGEKYALRRGSLAFVNKALELLTVSSTENGIMDASKEPSSSATQFDSSKLTVIIKDDTLNISALSGIKGKIILTDAVKEILSYQGSILKSFNLYYEGGKAECDEIAYTETYQKLVNNNGKYEYVWETKTSKWNHDSAGVYYYSESEPSESGKFWHYGENGEVVQW